MIQEKNPLGDMGIERTTIPDVSLDVALETAVASVVFLDDISWTNTTKKLVDEYSSLSSYQEACNQVSRIRSEEFKKKVAEILWKNKSEIVWIEIDDLDENCSEEEFYQRVSLEINGLCAFLDNELRDKFGSRTGTDLGQDDQLH